MECIARIIINGDSAKKDKPKPENPKKPPAEASPGYINENPRNANDNNPIEITPIFLNKIFTVFFDRVKPASNAANPRCIIKTKAVAINIHKFETVKFITSILLPL